MSAAFQETPNAALSRGLVVQLPQAGAHVYLRITHVFDTSIYAMSVADPPLVRAHRKPSKIGRSELEARLKTKTKARLGVIGLPEEMVDFPIIGSEERSQLEADWALIEPLVQFFEEEENLKRQFKAAIQKRAESLRLVPLTLQRLLLRFYYFGGIKTGLLPLRRGPRPNEGGYRPTPQLAPRRRGRQEILTKERGVNNFVVSEEDIADMVDALKSELRRGPTHMPHAYDRYLAKEFKRRHRVLYTSYMSKEIVAPVTLRQFRYYTNEDSVIEEDLAKNLRRHKSRTGSVGSLSASGPGEIYELDATGGRLYLLAEDGTEVGKPTIYLMIDRWSRYVVSIYISLQPPSYEELRFALLIAFTSRTERFRRLGVDVDDQRWPRGRVPAVITTDRGAEFVGEAFRESVVNDLRIDVDVLPPYCPDGKAIVERFIRVLKARMAKSLKGTFADRPLKPETKRAAKKARSGAIHNLAEAYRAIVEIVVDHNARPHSTLKRRALLAQNNVAPTPSAAYLWGLEHITGLRTSTLNDTDFYRKLLNRDEATLLPKGVRYRTWMYEPKDQRAVELLRKGIPNKGKRITVRVDKTFPDEVYVPGKGDQLATFQLQKGAREELVNTLPDEIAAYKERGNLLAARSEDEARTTRVEALAEPAALVKRTSNVVARGEKTAATRREMENLKSKLTERSEKAVDASSEQNKSGGARNWKQDLERKRVELLSTIRAKREEK